MGNYAYVTNDYSFVTNGSPGLQIIDISNPTAPTLAGRYDTYGAAIGVQIVGNYAYVADSSPGLQIIDISNPTAPTLTGSYDTSGYAYGVQVVGNYAYVPAEFSGLQIIDISNPTAPTLKGNYNPSGSASGVQVVGNYAYVADSLSGLQIIDISTPTAPTLTGNYNTAGAAEGVQIVGNYAYVADGFSGLEIIDISTPTAPTLTGSYDTSEYAYAYGVQVVGNYAYIAYGDSGLQIIDISNPTTPTLTGNYNTAGGASGVQIVGNYAYVTDWTSGLQIIDISNPTAPTLTGSYDTAGGASGVQIVGNYAYVADGDSGLQIIDISNPVAPTLTGNYNPSGYEYAESVQVVGNYAYVTNSISGLRIIDISNPTAPTLAGNYDTSGFVRDVQIVSNYAYVADGDGGLKILDVSDFIPLNQSPTDLALSNSTIAENQAIRTAVGTFTSTDPDTGNSFTYSLVAGTGSTDNALFTITGNQLQSNGIFDFETKNSYSIRVRTTDQGNLTFEKPLTIIINDVNEAPTAVSLNNQVTAIAENSSTTTRIKVADVAITDDALGTNNLSVSGTDASFFEVDATGLYIKANTVLNFETKTSYSVTVSVDDTTVGNTPDATANFTLNITNVNEAPSITDPTFSIEENSIFNTLIGQVVARDPDTNDKITFGITSGNTDVNGNGKTPFTIDSNTGEIKVNDPSDLNFEKNPTFNLGVAATDTGGLSAQSVFTINLNNVFESVTFSKSDSDVFTITSGDNTKPSFLFTVNSNNAKQTGEIGVFIVDDAAGNIDGVSPTQSGYAEKALSKTKSIFSIIDNQPNGFTENGLSRLVQFSNTARIRFYTINDKSATTDSVLNSKAFNKVNFSPIKDLNLTDLGGSFSINFNGINISIKPSDDALAIGTALQDKNEGEVLDLTQGFDTTAFSKVNAEFTVNREAAFNNFVGFYKIENAKGDIKKSDGSIVSVGQSGYIQAAIAGQVSGIDLSVANQSTATSTRVFTAGSIFAPFIVVNGSPSAILDSNPNNDPAVYFPFLGANTDKVDHIRLLGNNTFGFEDLPSGGDFDYNDIIVKVKLTPVA
jgi:hypothetical protein